MRRPNRFPLTARVARVGGILGGLIIASVAIADGDSDTDAAGPDAHTAAEPAPAAQAAPRLRLPPPDPNAVSFVAEGWDPGAPRPLVLWRWDGRAFVRLGETRSNASGRFDFGELPIALGEVYLDVAPRGTPPSTRRMQAVGREDPAPRLTSASGIGGSEIQVQVARREGELRVYAASDRRLLLRVAIDPTLAGALDLDLGRELGPRPPRAVWLEQVLANGTRTPAAYWRLDHAERSD
jgi:hypothetical protein